MSGKHFPHKALFSFGHPGQISSHTSRSSQYALLRIAGKRMIEASRVVKILWRHLTLSLGHPTLNTALYSSQWRVGLDDAGYLTPVLADTPFTGDVSVKHQRESVNLSCTKVNV